MRPLSAVEVERLIAPLRVFGLVAGIVLIALTDLPNDTIRVVAWGNLVVLTVSSATLWWWGYRTRWSRPVLVHLGFALDTLLIVGYAVSFAHLEPNVSWCVAFTLVADATIRYGVRGAVAGLALGMGLVVLQAVVHQVETGETTTLVGHAFVISTLAGVAGVLGLFSHLLRQQVRQQREQALALADALEHHERGIAAVAHEFRGALAVILGSASTARDKRDRLDDTSIIALLDDIESQGQHVARLVDGLLSHQGDRPGSLAIHPRQDDVATTIRAAAEASARYRRNHDLQLDLPPTICTLDHARLEQVVRNLLDNAYQHTNHGGRVSVRLRRLGVTIEVTVTDSGSGIPADRQERALRPFTRGLPGDEGLAGMGLYLVHQIVLSMGGALEIRSSARGTEVAVRVPAREFTRDRERVAE